MFYTGSSNCAWKNTFSFPAVWVLFAEDLVFWHQKPVAHLISWKQARPKPIFKCVLSPQIQDEKNLGPLQTEAQCLTMWKLFPLSPGPWNENSKYQKYVLKPCPEVKSLDWLPTKWTMLFSFYENQTFPTPSPAVRSDGMSPKCFTLMILDPPSRHFQESHLSTWLGLEGGGDGRSS